jgi:hypothetical protein
VRIERTKPGLAGRGGAKANVAVRPQQDGHAGGLICLPSVSGGAREMHEIVPFAGDPGHRRVVSRADDQQVMPRARQVDPARIPVARHGASGRRGSRRQVLADQRGARVRDVEHGAGPHHLGEAFLGRRGGEHAGPGRLDGALGQLVQAV